MCDNIVNGYMHTSHKDTFEWAKDLIEGPFELNGTTLDIILYITLQRQIDLKSFACRGQAMEALGLKCMWKCQSTIPMPKYMFAETLRLQRPYINNDASQRKNYTKEPKQTRN